MEKVGVIGSGSFGTAIAMLLAHNTEVLLYSRNRDTVEQINQTKRHMGYPISDQITAIHDLETLTRDCQLIFPVVPSANFRSMMKELSPYLGPEHFLIHCTKGFDSSIAYEDNPQWKIRSKDIHTMSEVILQESVVLRVGCLAGPNLAKEIMDGQPTASVIFSEYDEVISLGKKVLSSQRFAVFGSHETLGAEIAGALKNVIAIGSGILHGMGFGKNIQAVLINRGMVDMINLGMRLGTSAAPFLGTAGMGDLICTASSEKSRNFRFGQLIGKGASVEEAQSTFPELVEGYRTAWIVEGLSRDLGISLPIFQTIYRTLYKSFSIEDALEFLMRYPNYRDVDFL